MKPPAKLSCAHCEGPLVFELVAFQIAVERRRRGQRPARVRCDACALFNEVLVEDGRAVARSVPAEVQVA